MIIKIDTEKQSEEKALEIVKEAYSNTICSCFETEERLTYYTDYEKGFAKALGRKLPKIKKETRCSRTKGVEICHCDGDRRRCDFYKEVRGGE